MKVVFTDTTEILGTPFRVAIIPAGNPNRSGRALVGGKYTTSTVHETANTAKGANAEMHRRFVFGGGGPDNVSFHAVVDDREIIQLLPLDEVGWHAGDGAHGPGNSSSVATETCVNTDGVWAKTLDNLAKWQAFVLLNGGLTVKDVVQHNHWSGKDCPHVLRATSGWGLLLTKIEQYIRVLAVNAPLYVPPSTHPITGAFRAYYQAEPKALEYFGLPITDAMQERLSDNNTYTVQYFERARFELHGDSVQLGLVGAELLAKE